MRENVLRRRTLLCGMRLKETRLLPASVALADTATAAVVPLATRRMLRTAKSPTLLPIAVAVSVALVAGRTAAVVVDRARVKVSVFSRILKIEFVGIRRERY